MNDDAIEFLSGAHRRFSLTSMTPVQLRERVEMLEEGLRQLADDPRDMGAVIEVDGRQATVNTEHGMVLVARPAHLDVRAGQVVALSEKRGILAVLPKPASCGIVATVVKVVEPARRWANVQIKGDPSERIVIYPGKEPREEDQVLLDSTRTVIVENLGRKRNDLQLKADTGVSWDDIGGQETAKRELREAIEDPIVHADLFREYGKRPTKGILLWGAPGNGKTMLAKAVATAIARLHGASVHEGGFLSVKGPEILNHWVGMSEAGIRGLFASARQHQREHGYPPVIFIDEADAIFARRGRQGIEGMERTIVPQFLAEMDGLDEMTAVVMLATNRADVLDPAVVRPGRIDRKIRVVAPTMPECAAIVRNALRGRKIAEGETPQGLAVLAADRLFEDKTPLYMIRVKEGSDRRVTVSDFVSGAMCAGIAERAVQLALRRHVAGEGIGVSAKDIERAVVDSREELRGLDHEQELRTIAETLPPGTFKQVERVPPHERKAP
jgi:proteasome-associated ATPase